MSITIKVITTASCGKSCKRASLW